RNHGKDRHERHEDESDRGRAAARRQYALDGQPGGRKTARDAGPHPPRRLGTRAQLELCAIFAHAGRFKGQVSKTQGTPFVSCQQMPCPWTVDSGQWTAPFLVPCALLPSDLAVVPIPTFPRKGGRSVLFVSRLSALRLTPYAF